MAKQTIAIGSSANDGTGSSLRAAFDICNDNFTEIYDAATPSGANVTLQGDVTVVGHVSLADSKRIKLGTGEDLQIFHNGTDNYIEISTGHFYITNFANDSDIAFFSDDGSGGTTEYFRLDGGDARTIVSREFRFLDSVEAKFGTGGDLLLSHNGSNSYISNNTGDLYIEQLKDNGDIILKSDDGSGGTTEYFRLDGGNTNMVASKTILYNDTVKASFGNSEDLRIYHSGTNSNIENFTGTLQIIQNLDDGDISFKCDDGSSGTTEYFRVDGSDENVLFSKILKLSDNVELRIGSSNDIKIYHDTSNSYIKTGTVAGNLIIEQNTDDADIIFRSDDGSGGVAEYMTIDGSTRSIVVSASLGMYFNDGVAARFGTGGDLILYHDGTDSYIQNTLSGELIIENSVNDKDIIFKSDDGSGGSTEYFKLDGSQTILDVAVRTLFRDNVKATFGAGYDLEIYHDGSDSYVINETGNLTIRNKADDSDIVFQSDDGSGGVETYFKLDGGDSSANPLTLFPDNARAGFGASADLIIYHDASNSYIQEQGTGDLRITTSGGAVRINKGVSENIAAFIPDDTVELYYDNSKKFQTTSDGVEIIGTVDATQSSTSVPVLRLTDDGVCNYDFIFPDSDTIKLETSTSSTKTFKLLNAGSGDMNLEVSGSLSKGSGSFKIDHPVKPDTHYLYHSFVESPLTDLIYRGKAKLTKGKASINIDKHFGMTEGTFFALVNDKQVFTTNEDGWDAVKGKIEGNELHIECQNENFEGYVSWLVIGDRKDAHIVAADWTDEKGKPILEVEK